MMAIPFTMLCNIYDHMSVYFVVLLYINLRMMWLIIKSVEEYYIFVVLVINNSHVILASHSAQYPSQPFNGSRHALC